MDAADAAFRARRGLGTAPEPQAAEEIARLERKNAEQRLENSAHRREKQEFGKRIGLAKTALRDVNQAVNVIRNGQPFDEADMADLTDRTAKVPRPQGRQGARRAVRADAGRCRPRGLHRPVAHRGRTLGSMSDPRVTGDGETIVNVLGLPNGSRRSWDTSALRSDGGTWEEIGIGELAADGNRLGYGVYIGTGDYQGLEFHQDMAWDRATSRSSPTR